MHMCVLLFVFSIGTGGGQCRFCGSTNDTGLLAIGTVCAEKDCQERAKVICTKTLSCGHPCCGVQGEEECLPCLHGCKTKQDGNEVKSKLQELKQDADDMCMICYTENLSCAPCIRVSATAPKIPVMLCTICSWSVATCFIIIAVTWHSRKSGLVRGLASGLCSALCVR